MKPSLRNPKLGRWGWLAVAAGAIAALAFAAQPWWEITGVAAGTDAPNVGLGGAAGRIGLSGNAATAGLAAALATVCLVGTVLALTLRRLGRRVLAVILALLAVGMVVAGVAHPRPSDAIILEELRKTTLTDAWTSAATVWPWLYAVAGVLVVGGAVLVFGSAGSPSKVERGAARFERTEDEENTEDETSSEDELGSEGHDAPEGVADPSASAADGADPRTRPDGPTEPGQGEDSDSLWKALDRGDDPTDPHPAAPRG